MLSSQYKQWCQIRCFAQIWGVQSHYHPGNNLRFFQQKILLYTVLCIKAENMHFESPKGIKRPPVPTHTHSCPRTSREQQIKTLRQNGRPFTQDGQHSAAACYLTTKFFLKELHLHHLTKQLKLELLPNLNGFPWKSLLYPVYTSSIKQIMHACLAKYTGTHKQTSNYLAQCFLIPDYFLS